MDLRASRDKPKRYLANMEAERNSSALYTALAQLEKSPKLAEIYRRMAKAETRHAEAWKKFAEEAGARIPIFHPSLRTRLFIRMARTFGVGFILPTLTSLEKKDSGAYRGQAEADGMSREEQSHMELLTEITRTVTNGGAGPGARIEGRHRMGGGNALRAAVLGANDGLVSNLSLVMGVAGAHASDRNILVTGLAGLLAGACSMALGEWLSVQSSRESYRKQIDLEREEIEATPQEEVEELSLIYQARGLDEIEARHLAERLMRDKEGAVDTMAREELGIDTEKFGGSAWIAAGTSFLLFTFGALIPVLPFLFMHGPYVTWASLAAGALGLFALGAGVTLFTGLPVWKSGLRQTAFGLAAAAITFAMGRLVGIGLGG